MARAYKANGEWAARDFCCDLFGVPDQETKNELILAIPERGRCRPTTEGASPSLSGQLVVRA